MKMIIKVILTVVALYILIGFVLAIWFSLSYDPSYTSMPNNVSTFVVNVFLWGFNYL